VRLPTDWLRMVPKTSPRINLRRPLPWLVAAAAAALALVVSVLVAGNARTGSEATADRILDQVLAAQETAHKDHGAYASLWL
jgi:levanase